MTHQLSELEEGVCNVLQILAAISNDNKWYAGINFKPDPTLRDAVTYYLSFEDGKIVREFRERTERLRLEHKPQ